MPSDSPDRTADAEAYLLFERLRWPDGPSCPWCREPDDCRYLRPANGVDRRTRSGATTARRVWRCGACGRQFSVLTGTVFEGSRVPLPVWLHILSGWTSGDTRPGPGRVVRETGVAPETARHLVALLSSAVDALDPTTEGSSGGRWGTDQPQG